LEASFGVLEEVLEAILIDEKKKIWLTIFRIRFCWRWLPKVFGRWYWLRWRGLQLACTEMYGVAKSKLEPIQLRSCLRILLETSAFVPNLRQGFFIFKSVLGPIYPDGPSIGDPSFSKAVTIFARCCFVKAR